MWCNLMLNIDHIFVITIINIYTSSGANLPDAGSAGVDAPSGDVIEALSVASLRSFSAASNALIRFSCLTIIAFNLRISSVISLRSFS